MEVLSKEATLNKEWVTKVNAGIDAVEIFGQCLGKIEDTLTLCLDQCYPLFNNVLYCIVLYCTVLYGRYNV